MKRTLKKIFKMTLILLSTVLVVGIGYLYLNPQFGGALTDALKKQYATSAQWDGKKFVNQHETVMDIGLKEMPELIRKQFSGRSARAPQQNLPLLSFDKNAWQEDTAQVKFIWFGHSVGLLKMAGKNILIDPMFGPDTSPVGPVRTKRYTDSTLYIIDKLPQIDAVFITHDHYDHLDFDSFKKLQGRVGHYFVPLGVKRHLLRWDVPADKITELDWWQNATLGEVEITFLPARHFSGRGLADRATSLWGGYAFVTKNHRIFWSGDSGYDTHFAEIGEKLGPFDWAFVECGQYNTQWHAIHMYPEESVQAAKDVRAKTAIPIHWGAFTLAFHNWKEPVQRFAEAAETQNQPILMPKLGEVVHLNTQSQNQFWWQQFK
jgi:L-ascorbate metabolism protein UlaG (beta-lactamase superfamily)